MKNESWAELVLALVLSLTTSFLLFPFMLMDLWKWFVIPLVAVPELTYWHTFGLSLVTSILRGGLTTQLRLVSFLNKQEGDTAIRDAIVHFFVMLFAWGLGSFYHWMM